MSTKQTLTPLADVFESADDVLVVADVPGAKPSNVEVTLERSVLSFSADAGDFRYERSFELAPELDGERVSAELDAGVLRLSVPKTEAAKPRTIPVSAG